MAEITTTGINYKWLMCASWRCGGHGALMAMARAANASRDTCALSRTRALARKISLKRPSRNGSIASFGARSTRRAPLHHNQMARAHRNLAARIAPRTHTRILPLLLPARTPCVVRYVMTCASAARVGLVNRRCMRTRTAHIALSPRRAYHADLA